MRPSSEVWVVIPAAGSGKRLGSDTPKQYLPLNGKPLLEVTINKWLSIPGITKVVVALAETDACFTDLSLASANKVETVVGGAERCHSVMSALEFMLPRAAAGAWVLVHDAARPCFSIRQVEKMIEELLADEDGIGGIMAIPVADTLKKSSRQEGISRITATLDRSETWQAQTPQMFPLELLHAAMKKAIRDNFLVTDEASSMEYAGYKPVLFPGSAFNLKVTHLADLVLAEQIIREQLDA